jgi:N6-adenosine-specific RNA methylase IME4
VRYRTIVVDPPWEINQDIAAGGRRARATKVPYSMMSLQEIADLPVDEFAEGEAHLYLWSTRELFREGQAAHMARCWDFQPVGEIIWGLPNPGMGAAPFVNDHEPILVARRGGLPFTSDIWGVGVHFWRQLYVNGGKAHSAKPEGFLDLVESMSPGPRLEMFARRNRLGWDTWGNEALEHVHLGGSA